MIKYNSRISRVTALFVVAVFSLVACANSRQKADLESSIRKIFDDHKMSAMAIAVVKGDSIIYTTSLGHRTLDADGHAGDPIAEDDLFALASVSKCFVGTAVMRLVEEGKLSLKDDAQKYLGFTLRNPKYPRRSITLQHLLTHTSGLNDGVSWWNTDSLKPDLCKRYAESYNDYAPGKGYDYCNLNYVLLAQVIEGATGKRFDDEIERIVLNPLSIHGDFNPLRLEADKFVNTYYRDSKTGKLINSDYLFKQYPVLEAPRYKMGETVVLEYPAAGMKIDIESFARFMIAHMNGGQYNGTRIISDSSEKKMRKNYVGDNNYGLSFRQYPDIISGTVLHGQTGGVTGVKTAMIFNPDEKYGFVILTASAETDYIDGMGDIHKPLIQLLYDGLLRSGNKL